MIVEDFDAETRFRGGPALLRREGIVSGISVIIQGDEAPYGVLGAHTRTLRRFTRDDINFVQAAANVLAQGGIKRKAAEEALGKSEEKFREIAQRSFDMIYTCYYDRGITYMSPPAVTRILGYAPPPNSSAASAVTTSAPPCRSPNGRRHRRRWPEANR
ncbi:GAF domain-containing protein [Methanoculleus chikugoensis]|uniref:GAF domain-containing protein n=1 Tax=Methanoculleus chikugoensis TaxID=118126 RepID=UPI0006D074E6|nr:GAF domain-containing protein [Methanoculleus chikugoensis]